ncbi:hypothetical protein DMENIID0001_030840 [Sergentomyia squamirostris]
MILVIFGEKEHTFVNNRAQDCCNSSEVRDLLGRTSNRPASGGHLWSEDDDDHDQEEGSGLSGNLITPRKS